MFRNNLLILSAFLFITLSACKREKDVDLAPENTRISGRILRFGTNLPAAKGPMRIAIFEEEEATTSGSPNQIRLIHSLESDADGNFSIGFNALRHPRFKYYAQLQTKIDKHFDPVNYKFYFDAGQTQQLRLFQYPHAWLRVKVLPTRPGVGYNLSLTFANGSDYDIWGLSTFETTELLLGNSTQYVTAILSRQLSEVVSYSFNKYIPAFDTIEHIIEY